MICRALACESELRGYPPSMGEPGREQRAAVWCERHQSAFVERCVRRAGLRAVAAGFAPGGGSARAEPEAFADVARFDDPRRAIAEAGAGVLVMASASPPAAGAPSPLDDALFVGACRDAGVAMLSLEPCPSETGLAEPVESAAKADAVVRVVPLLRSSRVFADALDLIDQVGTIRSVAVHARSAPEHGTLGARLFDAMSAVERLIGLPDRVDCSITGAASAGEPVNLRGLAGHATGHLRYSGGATAGGRSAIVVVSNRAGGWFRGVTVMGDSGVLRFSDTRIELMSPTGEPLDRSTVEIAKPAKIPRGADLFANSAGDSVDDEAADLFALEIKRALDPSLGQPMRAGVAEALAMCGTALLSARTGAQEDTQTIMDMRGKR